MLRTQQWSPDTHDALFETQWDDADPEAPHVCLRAVIGSVESTDPQGDYERVIGVNRLKNQSTQTLIDALPADSVEPVIAPDGSWAIDYFAGYVYRTPKPSCPVSFDVHEPTGAVTLLVPWADEQTVAELHTAVTAAHGDDVQVLSSVDPEPA